MRLSELKKPIALLSLLLAIALSLESVPAAFGQQRGRGGGAAPGVIKGRVTPHWFAENTKFWYRNDLRDDAREFIVVDATAGKRDQAFDHAKLAAALTKADDKEYRADRLPFDTIEFVDDGKAIQFSVGDTKWKCNLANYELSRASEGAAADAKTGAMNQGSPSNAPETAVAVLDDSPAASTDESDDESADDLLASPQAQDGQQAQGAQRGRGFTRGGRGLGGGRGTGGRANQGGPAVSPDNKWTA